MKKYLANIVLLNLLAASISVGADAYDRETAGEFLNACKQTVSDFKENTGAAVDHGYCTGYIEGVWTAFAASGTVCFRDKETKRQRDKETTVGEIRKVVVDFMQAN